MQKSSLDIIKCLKIVKSTIISLQNMRNEDKFNHFFDEAVIAAQEQNISTPSNQTSTIQSRKINLSSKLNDSCVYSTVGQSNVLKCNTENEKYEIRRQYFEIIDTIIQEMVHRFDENKDLLTAVDACDPNSSNFMDVEKLYYLANIKGEDKSTKQNIASQSVLVKNMFSNIKNIVELHNELMTMKPAFQDINEIITRVLVIPVTSATAERSFSAMRRIKTYLRSTMSSGRLHNTAILSIERELSGQLMQDPSSIIDEFSKTKNRKICFSL